MDLPDYIQASNATLTLIIGVLSGTLPRESFYAAWEALPDSKAYEPTEQIEDWMREQWPQIVGGGQFRDCNEGVKPELVADQPLETLDLARDWSRPWMPKLITAYLEAGGVMSEACKAINLSDETVRIWRHRDPVFRAALEAVERQRNDKIRAVIHNHAIEGTLEPLIGSLGDYKDGQLKDAQGNPLFIRKFDHKLLMRYAEAHLPEYKRQGEGTTINTNVIATASATATAVVIPAEKLKSLQERNRAQLEKAATRALKAAGGNN